MNVTTNNAEALRALNETLAKIDKDNAARRYNLAAWYAYDLIRDYRDVLVAALASQPQAEAKPYCTICGLTVDTSVPARRVRGESHER